MSEGAVAGVRLQAIVTGEMGKWAEMKIGKTCPCFRQGLTGDLFAVL